jgi:hypothetical protein
VNKLIFASPPASLRAILGASLAFCALFSSCTKGGPDGAGWNPGAGFTPVAANARLLTRNAVGFESGNAAKVAKTGDAAYEVELRSDNDDALPKFWRNWYYFKLEGVPTNTPVTITIKGSGIPSYYLPVYSYEVRPDRRNNDQAWSQFSPAAVTQPAELTFQIKASFSESSVWIARWNPYTYSRLIGFLGSLRGKPGVSLGSLGATPRGRDIPSITVTDGGAPQKKQRIMIHARTHPGEVGSNFLLEGLLRFASGPGPEARRLRAKAVLDVVPMLNVDGVIAGNNRVTPQGINLEGKWYAGAGRDLDPEKTPPEVQLLHAYIEDRLKDGVAPTVALNLHASAGEPDDNVFFFPHFGPHSKGYAPAEANLNRKQNLFIGFMRQLHGAPWFNVPPDDGKAGFAQRNLPEGWWWRNYKDQVMAMTVESTYGRAARSSRWVTPDDMRAIGYDMGRALLRYVETEGVGKKSVLEARLGH